MARFRFALLRSKNTFKPYVLAKVTWNARGFVGSSIAVSAFLRPLCLYKRIISFKRRLQEAVVFAKALPSPSDDQAMENSWCSEAYTNGDGSDQATGSSSTAFKKANPYAKHKDPCEKCQHTFKKLSGFIRVKDSKSARGDRSFWGGCAEYCPVSNLLPNDKVEDEPNPEMEIRLRKHREQCSSLFRDIWGLCELAASDVPDAEKQLKVAAKALESRIQIFGFRPNVECGNVIV